MPEMNRRLLLVEDDEISCAFLSAALASLPAQVDVARSISEACALATAVHHALWLVDAHLPDGDGVMALSRLRALHPGVSALAVTADDDVLVLDRLCAAGFMEVLQKPIGVAALLAAVRRALGEAPKSPVRVSEKLPAWDEDQALRAVGGSFSAVLALRTLFINELPQHCQSAYAAADSGDLTALQSVLHKLKAGAGFVGAARLLQAISAWSITPSDARLRQAFVEAVADQLTSTYPDPPPDRAA